MNDKELRAKLKKIADLQTLPAVVQRVNKTVSRESSTAAQLAAVIEKDQALSSKMLKLANSSYYGLSRKVDSISRAITVLGFNAVRDLAFTVSVYKIFTCSEPKGGLDVKGLWEHSLAVGIAANILLEKQGAQSSQKAFLAGLLHDIGRVVINSRFPEEQAEIQEYLYDEQHPDYLAVEKKVLGTTHAHIGGVVCDLWHFPQQFIEPVMCHHEPSCAGDLSNLTTAVFIANHMVKVMGLGKAGSPFALEIEEGLWQKVGIKADDLQGIVGRIYDDFESVEDFMQL